MARLVLHIYLEVCSQSLSVESEPLFFSNKNNPTMEHFAVFCILIAFGIEGYRYTKNREYDNPES